MQYDYDLFVIGGGSGGVRAARLAAEAGQRVALAEQSHHGGTCVMRGCVPKKLMTYAAGYAQLLREAPPYGWKLDAFDFDWPGFRTRLQSELQRLSGLYRQRLAAAGVELFDLRARLLGPQRVGLVDGRSFTARHVLVATGAHPLRADFEGADLALVSDDMFELEALPRRLLVIGGGYIACEFASLMNGMGVEVSLYHRGDRLLSGFDREAAEHLAAELQRAGVTLCGERDVQRIRREGESLQVDDQRGGSERFEQVLLAIGRRPNTADLGLDALGLELGRHGEIPVDACSRTALPWLHAIGDVTHRLSLTPVAIDDAAAFVATVFEGQTREVDHAGVPTAVFTQPELGSVGLSEAQAAEQGPVEIYATRFRPMRSAFVGDPGEALMKLSVCARSQRVLGCQIVAPGAAELIQLVAVAMKAGASKQDFDRTMALHPTLAEELVTLRRPSRRH